MQTLTEERPYDEELALRLVRAHCDSGNPAAALRAYEAVRARLDRELSTRPGEALRAAGERLLHPVRPADGGTARSVTARTHEQLRMPEPTGYFVGRERELRELDALLTPGRAALTVTAAQSSNLAVISGMAGGARRRCPCAGRSGPGTPSPTGSSSWRCAGTTGICRPWNPPRRSPGSCSRWDSPPPTSRSGWTNGPRCTGRCSSDGGC